jgi:hypothetical protein
MMKYTSSPGGLFWKRDQVLELSFSFCELLLAIYGVVCDDQLGHLTWHITIGASNGGRRYRATGVMQFSW